MQGVKILWTMCLFSCRNTDKVSMAGVEWVRRRMAPDDVGETVAARPCWIWCCPGGGVWTLFLEWWEASGGFSAEEGHGHLSWLLLERTGLLADHWFCKVVFKTQRWLALLYEGEFDSSQPGNRCSVSRAINGAIYQIHWLSTSETPKAVQL